MDNNLGISVTSDVTISNRSIFHNDCLQVMKIIKDDSIDLIYLDPPFNSGTDYRLGEKGFTDKWDDSINEDPLWVQIFKKNERLNKFICLSEQIHSRQMKLYLIYMSIRLVEMQRILKLSGKIVLHCDDNASHYLKVCLDSIFGPENFRNDIALLYRNGSKNAKNHFPRNKDNLLIYCKDVKENKFFNKKSNVSPKTQKNIEKGWKITWNTRSNKWHETYYRPYETFSKREVEELNAYREKKLAERDAEIHIRIAINGKEIKYLDWWDDMVIIQQSDKNIKNPKNEAVGWPTQKSVKIPQRVIETCTEVGDIVYDPFCGSGTTCEASESMGRKWIASDISEDAVDISIQRIEDFMGLFGGPLNKEKV